MEDPQRSVIGEEEHHEKKSMMKKVRDRAVKIKDTLKKRGYGRDHVNEEENDEHEEEEDDDDDGVQDPEAHGAAGQGGHPGRSGVHLGNTQPLQEDSNKSGASEALPANYEAKTTDPSSTVFESTTAHNLEGQGGHPGRSGVHLGNPQPYQEDSIKSGASEASANYEAKTTDPSSTVFESTTAHTLEGQGGHPGRSGVHLDNPQPYQEDSNKSGASEASSANYEAKTTDPSSTVFESTTAHTMEGQGGHPGRSGVHLDNTQPYQEDSNKSGASEASSANYEAKSTDPSSTVFESTTAHTLEGQGGHPRGSGVHSGNPQPHQEDSNKSGASEASPANYEAMTTEPSFTGGGEAHLSPITHSFQEMQISEEPKRITAHTLEGQGEYFGRSGVHSGNPQPLQEDPNQPDAGVDSPANYEAKTTDPSSTGGEEAHVSPVNRSFQEMMISEEPEKTNAQTLEGEGGGHLGRSGVHSGNPQPLQENPNQLGAGVDSPTNYQTKTTDPSFTGAEEAHVSPVNRSFQEMMVSEEPEKTNAQTLEGEGGHLGRSGVHSGNPQPLQENPNPPGAGVDSPVNYQAKTTDPSFTGEAEAHVSPNSSQEMKVSEEPEKTEDSPRGIHDEFSPTTPPSKPTPTQAKPKPTPNHPQSYTEKITSTATAISGKATAAASTVYETVTGKTTQGLGEKGVSMREYLVGKLSPGEEDKTLSEIISEAMHRKKEGEPLVGTEGAVETENGVVRKEEGVVGKMKGAVTSLFKKGENGAVSSSPEVKKGQGEIHHEDTEGRRPQESGN